jgi:hypothetical protein
MPETDDRLRFEDRGRRLELDQNNDCCRDRNGRGGMHDNAQRAVVCVTLNRMDVRDLDHGEERQQDQAHHGGYRPGS